MSPHVGWNLSRALLVRQILHILPGRRSRKRVRGGTHLIFPCLLLDSSCSCSSGRVLKILTFQLLLFMKDFFFLFPHCTRKALSKLEQINFLLRLFGTEHRKFSFFSPSLWLKIADISMVSAADLGGTRPQGPSQMPSLVASHSQPLQPCNFPDDLRFWNQMKQWNCFSC